MSVIENFAVLPVKDQLAFAEALVKTINSEKIFSADTQFEITGIETDDFSGGLVIGVAHADSIEVPRKATWQATDEDAAESDPGYDADYEDYLFEDAKKAFKTLSTIIDGYKVSLDIADVDETETVEVSADHISHEDAGIGDYEYWGHHGHDSRPYVEVEGTIVKACDYTLTFFVEPDDTAKVELTVDEEN